MKPGIYKVSWWNRANVANESVPQTVNEKQFNDETMAARFLDGLSSARYWTKIETISEPSV